MADSDEIPQSPQSEFCGAFADGKGFAKFVVSSVKGKVIAAEKEGCAADAEGTASLPVDPDQ